MKKPGIGRAAAGRRRPRGGKAKSINTSQVEGRMHYSYRSVAGDVFVVVRPETHAEEEKAIRQELVEMLEEDRR